MKEKLTGKFYIKHILWAFFSAFFLSFSVYAQEVEAEVDIFLPDSLIAVDSLSAVIADSSEVGLVQIEDTSFVLPEKRKVPDTYYYVQDSKPKETDTTMFFSWKSVGPLGTPVRAYADTTLDRFHIANIPEKNSIAYSDHASLGSPGLSLIFDDRIEKSDFFFMRPYDLSYLSSDDILFYNTKKPLSRFSYIGAGPSKRSDRCVSGLFTVNANKKLNFGAFGDWISSYGAFEANSTRDCNAGFFSSYMGRRSNVMMSIGFTKFESYENGGVRDENVVISPEEYGNISEENIPVNITNYTFSKLHGYNMHLNYKYHLGFDKEIKLKNDSVITDYIPVSSIILDAKYESDWKRYNELAITGEHDLFYGIADSISPKERNLNNKITLDSVLFRQLKMNLGMSLNEEFNKLMRFGLGAYYIINYKSYHYTADRLLYSQQTEQFIKENKINEDFTDSLGYFARPLWAKTNPMKMGIGATLSKHSGSHVFYNILGEYYFLDEKKTGLSFKLAGDLTTKFDIKNKMPIRIGADFLLENKCPDLFEEFYYSNYFTWSNDFENKTVMKISGKIAFDKIGFSAKASYTNLSNYIYYSALNATPVQHSSPINVLHLSAREKLKFWWFTWDNEVCLQRSDEEYILPLPSFSWYSNFFFRSPAIFKNSLTIQLGADCRYFSKYYAQKYMPATGLFYTNTEKEYGGYPFISAYASVQLKQLQFFVVWNHLNQEMGNNRNYMASPGYPMTPSFVRMGISVSFDD